MILSTFKNMVDDMGMGKMDYRKLGGGVFLGVKKPIIKAHGNSNKTAFYYTLKQAEEYAKAGIIEELTEKMGRENN